jgi:hypothetical protein
MIYQYLLLIIILEGDNLYKYYKEKKMIVQVISDVNYFNPIQEALQT